MTNRGHKALLTTALTRMNLRDTLIGERYIGSMLVPLINDAVMLGDTEEAAAQVMEDVRISYGFPEQADAARKPFVYHDGVAIIPVHGILINRFSYSWGFVTGYNFIRAQMNAALEDEDVELIVYDVDSPGGEAVGCFELATEIRESRAVKPSLAVVDALAASGGYALGSAPTRMVCTPSGSVGSIGVYILHLNYKGALEGAGIEATYIAEGDWKTAGNSLEPLSREVRADLQRCVHNRAEEFYALVAENRSISVESVRNQESRIYRAEEALALGLLDAVQSPQQAVSDFLAELGRNEPEDTEEDQMADEAGKGEISSEQRQQITAEAETAAKTRIGAILTSEEAKGREDLANHFAFNTDMTAEAAVAALKVAPKAEAEGGGKEGDGDGDGKSGDGKGGEGSGDGAGDGGSGGDGKGADDGKGEDARQPSRFEQAMNEGGGANAGAGGGASGGAGETGEAAERSARIAAMCGAQSTLTGVQHRKPGGQQQSQAA